jgi:hypothetical protein
MRICVRFPVLSLISGHEFLELDPELFKGGAGGEILTGALLVRALDFPVSIQNP